MGQILTDGMLLGSGGSGTNITVVQNFDALPDPATVAGSFYWASESQGTQWLPFSLGGTYYNSGLYYSNGVDWEYHETPYNASQAQVNTGTNATTFVSPATLAGYSRWASIFTTPLMFGGARNTIATDSYLQTDGVYTNVVPVELPVNAKIKTIIAGTDGPETWTAEIHGNGSPIAGAFLALTATDSGSIDGLSLSVTAGTKLSLYCNGTNIKRPRIFVILSNEV